MKPQPEKQMPGYALTKVGENSYKIFKLEKNGDGLYHLQTTMDPAPLSVVAWKASVEKKIPIEKIPQTVDFYETLKEEEKIRAQKNPDYVPENWEVLSEKEFEKFREAYKGFSGFLKK